MNQSIFLWPNHAISWLQKFEWLITVVKKNHSQHHAITAELSKPILLNNSIDNWLLCYYGLDNNAQNY